MLDTTFSIGRQSRIKQVDVHFEAPRVMRVYSESPDRAAVQIRINGPTTDSGRGEARKMVATAVLSEDEVRTLRDLLDEELGRLSYNRARAAA